jgi:hypothetical protein
VKDQTIVQIAISSLDDEIDIKAEAGCEGPV